MKKIGLNRILSLLLAGSMAVSLMPVTAFAGTEAHTHTEACYTEESRLVCGLEESSGHEHGEDCYDEEGGLICELEEQSGHSHGSSCYEVSRSLICGLEETYEEPVQEAEPESQDTVEAQTEESAETTEVTDENFEEVVEELSEENGSEEAASEEAADTVGEGISRSFIIRALTEDGTPVFGIQYLIRNKEGEPVAEKQTDENGVCQLEDLAVGTYSMEETAGPDRIQWNTDAEPDSFRVSEQEAENEKTVIYAEITQTGITANVSWQNIEDQEIALPTIYLQLFHPDGSIAEVKELNSAPWSVTWDGLDETDSAGHAIDYSAKVVDENGLDYTPDGYVKEEEGLQITLTRRTEEAREDDEVTITKTDAEGTPVYGAEVTLFDGDDEIATYEGGTFTISTADPELQPYLPEADESKILYLRETKAPEGYEADLTSYPVLLTAMEEVSLEEDVFLTTMMYGVNAAEEESGNKRITIPEDTETISVSNKLKTNLTNADFHFDEDKVSTYDPGTSEADGVKRIVVKNPTYQSDGSTQSKDGWSVDDLGYIRFQNAGVLSGENVDVLLYIDRVEFGDWAGTAKNKHADNKTGEWIVFSEITDNTINFSGSVGGIKNNEAGKKVKESYFWYGSLKVYVTTKIVNAGTEETVDGEQFLQVVADMDINHSNNSATNTTGNFTVEGFRTLSGFTGEYYAWDAAIWNMESSNAGQMHFYANEASIKLNGRESYTKGAVYTMTEGPEFSSVYEEGDCGARYEVYMMQSPEINITKSVDPEEYVPGDIVTYTINVKMGTWLVDTFMVYNSMSITDNLPDGLTLVDASISENANGSLETDSGSASYQFDESWLADESHYDGREYTLTIQAKVNEEASGNITNTAQSAITTRGGKGSKAEDSATIQEKLFNVTHEFVSGTEGKELPDELKNRTPSDQTGKKDGEEVTPGSFDKTEYKVDGGTWKFKSWDADSKTIDKADEHFTGTWVFVEDPKEETYKVTHEFVSGTPGKELPEELKNRTPSDQTGKKDGEKVTPGSFDKTEYKVEGASCIV